MTVTHWFCGDNLSALFIYMFTQYWSEFAVYEIVYFWEGGKNIYTYTETDLEMYWCQ